MAGEGFEKISEIPVEFIKEGTTFLNRCTKPDASGKNPLIELLVFEPLISALTMFLTILL